VSLRQRKSDTPKTHNSILDHTLIIQYHAQKKRRWRISYLLQKTSLTTTTKMYFFLIVIMGVLSISSCFVSPKNNQFTAARFFRRFHSNNLCMVRNIDLCEAIIFYGRESLFQKESLSILLPGVKRLVDECRRDETAVLAILKEEDFSTLTLPTGLLFVVQKSRQPPPNPRDVWQAIHSITIKPKGFGGSSGFGKKVRSAIEPLCF
jgi:hypothetical protein